METKNLIRYGKVSAVYPERATARVVYDDKDNMVSAELPVLQAASYQSRFYSLPKVGDNVVCLMAPNGEDGFGFILGSFYSEVNKPPTTDGNKLMLNISDKLVIAFDESTSELTINCKGRIRINGKRVDIN
ncbi:MAG: phage baseplate assembly protein V [Selenomonadaceae bacterium]|nr:phage baseplate assembly protein V [Selenomonadaceae bacterium]